jgi:hypothetical protein
MFSKDPCRTIPTPAHKLKHLKIIDVACGAWHTAIVTGTQSTLLTRLAEGHVYTFGKFHENNLGTVSQSGTLCRVMGLNNCLEHQIISNVYCAAMGTENFVVSDLGRIFAWGGNNYGNLGNKKKSGSVKEPIELDYLGKKHVVDIVCMRDMTFIRLEDEDLYTKIIKCYSYYDIDIIAFHVERKNK